MNLKYFAIHFKMGQHDHEIWMALLGEWPFESFQQEEDRITGYIQDHDITKSLMEFITGHQESKFIDFDLTQVPDKNWNEVWESSFNPVAVDDYCYIRAEFHKPVQLKFKHVVTISPKMAFGTGHHATTYMMLQAMSGIDFKGKKVLDFGCGTGILAIVAAKEGASKVNGVDIQPEAIENSEEHAAMNGVSHQCKFILGYLEHVNAKNYDVILANINRNVVIESLPELTLLLTPGGHLLVSGIMFDDVEIVSQALSKLEFEIIERNEKDQWVQLTLIRTPD